MSSLSGISGLPVATLREGQKQIPVVTRLRMDERAQLADLHNLYVYAAQSAQKVLLLEVAGLQSTLATQLSAARRAAVEPLCYAQIGGLSVATFIELLLVPVLYAVFVLNLKLVTWETTVERSYVGSTETEA